MKKVFAIVCIGAMMLALTGCVDHIKLSDNEAELVAQYGVNILEQNDKKFARNLEYTTEETTTKKETTTTTKKDEKSTEKGTELADPKQVAESMGISEFEVAYKGHSLHDIYPSESAQYKIGKAGYKVLALNFTITNPTANSINVDMIRKFDFQAILNEKINVNVVNAVSIYNALNMFEATIGAGESVDVVLLFYVKPEDASAIKTIALKVTDQSKKSTTVNLE